MKRNKRGPTKSAARKRSSKVGLPPGSLVRVGREVEDATGNIQFFEYDEDNIREEPTINLSSVSDLDASKTYWLNIDEIDDTKLISAVGEKFHLHPLLVEDILNTEHRPKFEEFEDHIFVVLKMIALSADGTRLEIEQLSLVLGSNYVLSFQERPGDILDPVRERLRHGLGRLRKRGADYLLYALMDLIVDHYFLIIETLSERIDDLEQDVISNPHEQQLQSIMEMRSLLIKLRRSAGPTQELAAKADLTGSELITHGTKKFFNDVRDHAIHVYDSIDTFRDTLTGMEQSYHAMVNLRTSKVVNLLTIITTIFVPLTFIAGIYGMNFDNMPELHSQHGYFYALGGMLFTALILLGVFRWKKWL